MKLTLLILCRLIAGFALMVLVHGCATLDNYLPASPQQISAGDESRLGAAVERRLLQMLGGLYQDEELSALMTRMGKKVGIDISIADKSSAAVYPLPGERVVLTRGLLMEMESLDQLETLLKNAASMSHAAMNNIDSRAMTKEVQGFLSAKGPSYDPDSAEIRIARHFASLPCEEACLYEAMHRLNGQGTPLPEPVLALQAAKP
ncbi:MAG: hypothetical protein GWO30_04525, partial [Gammaproteobacteria bacterium]|nr:hypothetical protein [Gammaproteobacteria bacterium]NIQ08767.1 hypothetical protein [Gammaproteobacteria bacterium]NIY19721.1 hypothetical protein [Gammaproteobacteria bacterium]